MKSIDRIWKALNHEEPDRIPTFTQSIHRPLQKRFVHELKNQKQYVKYVQFQLKRYTKVTSIGFDFSFDVAAELGYDSKWRHWGVIKYPNTGVPEITKKGYKGNKHLRVGRNGSIHQYASDGSNWYVDGALKTPELITEFAEYLKQGEAPELIYKLFHKFWTRCLKKNIVPIPTAGGINNITWAAIGMNKFSYIARKHPKQLRQLIDAHVHTTIEQHKQLFENMDDYPMCYICDDYAQKDRLMMSPTIYESFFESGYKAIADNAHKYGAKILMHSDGNLMGSLPALARAGFDAIEPLEYEAGMRIPIIREQFPKRFCLIGNIPASDALCVGTKTETIRYTLQAILDVDGCGAILGQGANLLPGSKIENVRAMIDTIKKYGTYPIKRQKIERYLNSLK